MCTVKIRCNSWINFKPSDTHRCVEMFLWEATLCFFRFSLWLSRENDVLMIRWLVLGTTTTWLKLWKENVLNWINCFCCPQKNYVNCRYVCLRKSVESSLQVLKSRAHSSEMFRSFTVTKVKPPSQTMVTCLAAFIAFTSWYESQVICLFVDCILVTEVSISGLLKERQIARTKAGTTHFLAVVRFFCDLLVHKPNILHTSVMTFRMSSEVPPPCRLYTTTISALAPEGARPRSCDHGCTFNEEASHWV